jgi:hypothetical protein
MSEEEEGRLDAEALLKAKAESDGDFLPWREVIAGIDAED